MCLSRRALLGLSGVAVLGAGLPARAAETTEPLPPAIAALAPMTDGFAPISLDERRDRLARAQARLAEAGLDALLVASGSSLDYFTGAAWGLSERFFGMVLTREGDPAWVTPAFEKERALEQIRFGSDVRPWEEHESPYGLVAAVLRDRGVATGRVGIEEAMPFGFADGVARALPALRVESGTPVTAGCRMTKDSHEVALIRQAPLHGAWQRPAPAAGHVLHRRTRHLPLRRDGDPPRGRDGRHGGRGRERRPLVGDARGPRGRLRPVRGTLD
jgi:Xaa-Pro dipeptidase